MLAEEEFIWCVQSCFFHIISVAPSLSQKILSQIEVAQGQTFSEFVNELLFRFGAGRHSY